MARAAARSAETAAVAVPASAVAAPSADLDAALEALGTLPGLSGAALAEAKRSETLRRLVADALSAGLSPVVLVEHLKADGPLKGRSPVGILVAALRRLVQALLADEAVKRQGALEGCRRLGRRLGGMQLRGELPEETALAELRLLPVGELRETAICAYLAAVGKMPAEEVLA